MKHIPIIGKILSILAAFGIFVIVISLYTTGGMRMIASRYADLIDHQGQAALYLARSSQSLANTRASIAEFMISTMDASNQADLVAINANEKIFHDDMVQAAALDPSGAAGIMALEKRDLQTVDDSCLDAINQGLNAMDSPSVLSAQAVFLKECSPIFPGLTLGITNEANRIAGTVTADEANLRGRTGSTIRTTFLAVLGGLILAVLAAFLAVRIWVTLPVKRLQNVMGRLLARRSGHRHHRCRAAR